MLGQCFLLQCQAIATRCEHGGGGAVKGGLLQDTWKDTWKPFYQLIQGILCQLIPKLLSNIELDTAGEGGGVGLFEDMTALVVALSLCVGTSTSSPAPLSNTAALPVISRERRGIDALYESVGNRAKAVLQTFAQSKLVALHLYNQTVTEEMSHRGQRGHEQRAYEKVSPNSIYYLGGGGGSGSGNGNGNGNLY
ncbi:uncharacterized protein SEPMUDRAFT_132890 [Sphaerulina musiva SO2202]|uniref:Uncharacterized protein n=1 Tax=Sphaerulina musiva (strain SO2202) TaxID=692275 RepID=M3D6X6_SPHMS|nr:uncharacterized protein SEPMUDRAFT_132890 [Sphaerulina musiva SO2202]EMF13629.1 hypothetical protein SEPMUDRAFT_132890 [Sphaerulina musiva SO2202]